jgi:tRNA pseudouridine65 synthase
MIDQYYLHFASQIINSEIIMPFDEKPILTILYQDDYIVAVDKPAGLFVHRSYMDKDEIYFALQLVRDQIGQYVYPLHRLDRPTSGVLLVGLNEEVARLMGQAFMDK